jgi:DUF1680 family protein
VNPLASDGNHHRKAWYDCACCPPNLERFIASLPSRVYATQANDVYVNVYTGSEANIAIGDSKIHITQQTDYPWNGTIFLTVTGDVNALGALRLRVPQWSTDTSVSINGAASFIAPVEHGYMVLRRSWRSGDIVQLTFQMPVRRIYADPRVKANVGRVALERGPIVYCAEAVDNGGRVTNLYLPADAQLKFGREDILGGVTVIKGKAMAVLGDGSAKQVEFTAVPYYAWDNREPGEMAVWLAEDPSLANLSPK